MKPVPPVKPIDKLPFTYHLTLVQEPGDAPKTRRLVATKMQGPEVCERVVLDSFDDRQEALDELNRVAVRLFYFEAPQEIFGRDS